MPVHFDTTRPVLACHTDNEASKSLKLASRAKSRARRWNCEWLLLHERICALDGEHAFRLQLRCGSVNIRLIQSGELSYLDIGPPFEFRRSIRKGFKAKFSSIFKFLH